MVNERHNVKTSDQNEFFRIKTLIDRDPHLLRVTNINREYANFILLYNLSFYEVVKFYFCLSRSLLVSNYYSPPDDPMFNARKEEMKCEESEKQNSQNAKG